jgi:N-methylhydantoinase A
MVGSRLLTGAGYLLKVPAIDLAELGAGGGSLVRVNAAGGVSVGPESASSTPGPVCYDQGGTEPTITDANVILGYINPRHLFGGAVALNAARAAAVFEEKVARPLGLALARAAHGAHLIAASNMIRTIRAVSTERGRDPRGFSLFAPAATDRSSPAAWLRRWACGASSCRHRQASSPPSACFTPTPSIITRAVSAASRARSTLPS